MRWCIDRFSKEDNLYRKGNNLEEQIRAVKEVVAESFLSDVFLNRDDDYFKKGLIVDLTKLPGAIWAAMVQTRIFYEFPDVAKLYFSFREKGFSVDQSVILCQIASISEGKLYFRSNVGSHGTTKSFGSHGACSLKKYFNRGWDYLNNVGTPDGYNQGSFGFSRSVFLEEGKKLETFETVEELFDFFNGEKDV